MKKYYFILVYLLCYFQARTQLSIRLDELVIGKSQSGMCYRLDASDHFKGYSVKEILKKDWTNLSDNTIKLNRLTNSLWLKIPIKQITAFGTFKYLRINNPHINFLECLLVKDSVLLKRFNRTGDNLPFNTRTLPILSFDFPINQQEYADAFILLLIDKRYTYLNVPLQFCSESYYVSITQNLNGKIGLMVGFCLFLLVLNSVLYGIVKQHLFLWYGLFLICILMYLLTDSGILFKLLYPNTPMLNDLIRPFALSFSIVPLILFFNHLLNFQQQIPIIYRINKILLYIFIPLFLTAIYLTASGNYASQGNWLQVFRILSPLLMILLIAESAYSFWKGLKYAVFSLLSFSGTTLLLILYSLQQSETIPVNWFTTNANYVAIFWEFIIMSIALAWRYQYYKQESEFHAIKNREQQERIFRETASYQEKEMQRVSSLLHDTVGARLGLLRLESDRMDLSNEAREKLSKNITLLGNEVREMSHQFSPVLLQEKGIYAAVSELVQRTQLHSGVDLQFEWIGNTTGIAPQYEILLYQIAHELLQNLIKHSQATNAFLQIMLEQNLISIYAENDGVMSKTDSRQVGIGLKSIENLISLLGGRYQMQLLDQENFSISIEFNVTENE